MQHTQKEGYLTGIYYTLPSDMVKLLVDSFFATPVVEVIISTEHLIAFTFHVILKAALHSIFTVTPIHVLN